MSHLKILLGCFSTCSRIESHKTHRLEKNINHGKHEQLVFDKYLRMTFCHFYWWLWAKIPRNPAKKVIIMKPMSHKNFWYVFMCVCFHEQVMGGGLLSSRMDEPAHTATTTSFIFDIFFSPKKFHEFSLLQNWQKAERRWCYRLEKKSVAWHIRCFE